MATSSQARRSSAEASAQGRKGAYISWANTDDRSARTRAARDGFTAKLAREIDPDGILPPDELARRVESARKAYMADLSMRALKKRRQAKEDQRQLVRIACACGGFDENDPEGTGLPLTSKHYQGCVRIGEQLEFPLPTDAEGGV